VCVPCCSCAPYVSGPTATNLRSTICARTEGARMAERIWDSSEFYARIRSVSHARDSAVNGSHWRELYRAALFELDLDKLSECVKAAEEAIRARASLNGGIRSDERIAIQDATSALNVLKAGIKRSNRVEQGLGS
jgi:hypothetical protein